MGRAAFATCLLSLALGLLTASVAAADPDHFDPSTVDYVEDPYAPHNTSGTTARVGSIVGYFDGQRQDVMAIGAIAAVGQRFGRLTLEAEVAAMSLESTADQSQIGDAERLGAIARVDVIRLGPHIVGPNSLLSIYIEGGGARAWNHWYRPNSSSPSAMADLSQVVPEDNADFEGIIGFGLMLDHRLQEPISFPHRIGWFLGWRMAYAPHGAETAVICRGSSTCSSAPAMPDTTYVDQSMLFQSSLSVTW
jgi:hypothetical protein